MAPIIIADRAAACCCAIYIHEGAVVGGTLPPEAAQTLYPCKLHLLASV
jgi:hypothetical protein